jgi:cytochrome c oxidase subunit 4
MSDHGPQATAGGHNAGDHGHADGDHAHGGSVKTYMAVFIALCVLTTASFMTWTPMWHKAVSDNKHVAWAFMMAISCTKALLVILFFMHLKYEANWKYVLTFPAAFMSIFLALMLVPDVGLRFWHYSRDRLEFCAIPEDPHGAGPPAAAQPSAPGPSHGPGTSAAVAPTGADAHNK